MIGKQFTLNNDKFAILAARNWECDIEDLKKDLDFDPKYSKDKEGLGLINERLEAIREVKNYENKRSN